MATVDGVIDAVAGARTVLVIYRPGAAGRVRTAFESGVIASSGPASRDALVEVPVVYDGADLADVAAETGLDVDEVVARHQAGEFVVRFCGFSPGFAYLDGLDPELHVSRRSEPRTTVPAGSVAIAGEFTGIYPRASPGGWRLLGRTALTLWDVDR